MSVPEIGYRVSQYLQKSKEKRSEKIPSAGIINWEEIYQKSMAATQISDNHFLVPIDLIKPFETYNSFQFFSYQIDLDKNIDWHLDISTNNRFPFSFSKDID